MAPPYTFIPIGTVAYEMFQGRKDYFGDEAKQEIWKSDWFITKSDDNDSLLRINSYTLQLFSDYNSDANNVKSANQFHIIQDNELKQCEILIKRIGDNTRSNFYS